jgi:hypothetical protein
MVQKHFFALPSLAPALPSLALPCAALRGLGAEGGRDRVLGGEV